MGKKRSHLFVRVLQDLKMKWKGKLNMSLLLLIRAGVEDLA